MIPSIIIALMLILTSNGWTQVPPLPTPMKVIEVDDPTLIVLKNSTQRLCIQHQRSMICWSVPEGTTDMIQREFPVVPESKESCLARLAEALKIARRWLPYGLVRPIPPACLESPVCLTPGATDEQPVQDGWPIFQEIDALLKDCP